MLISNSRVTEITVIHSRLYTTQGTNPGMWELREMGEANSDWWGEAQQRLPKDMALNLFQALNSEQDLEWGGAGREACGGRLEDRQRSPHV